MKKLFILLTATGGFLSGCVGYAAPYNNEPVYSNSPTHRTDDGRNYRGERDRDRDGVPNRVDRDRDGDGVPNRIDNRPNNPYRY